MSTAHQITHPLSPRRTRVRPRAVAIVVALAAALAVGLLAITGTFDGTRASSPARGGHLAPAVQYPGTGQPPVSHVIIAGPRHLAPSVQYPGTGLARRLPTP